LGVTGLVVKNYWGKLPPREPVRARIRRGVMAVAGDTVSYLVLLVALIGIGVEGLLRNTPTPNRRGVPPEPRGKKS